MGDRGRVPRPPPASPGVRGSWGAAQRLARGVSTKLCYFGEFSPDKHPETRPDKHPDSWPKRPDKHPEYVQVVKNK